MDTTNGNIILCPTNGEHKFFSGICRPSVDHEACFVKQGHKASPSIFQRNNREAHISEQSINNLGINKQKKIK